MVRVLVATLLLLSVSAVQGRKPDCTRIKGCSSCRLARVIGKGTQLLCDACDKGWTLRKDGRSQTCDCAAGWAMSKAGDCTLCTKGLFCPGGDAVRNPGNTAVACPAGLTTIIAGAMSQGQCFTQPGYGRASTTSQDGQQAVSAALCGVGEYNGGSNTLPCQKCGAGLTTVGRGSTSAAQCLAPPGYYFDRATVSAKRCQKGTYSPSFSTSSSCMRCPADASTAVEGATSPAACVPVN
eukprot:GHRQ01017686.1.p1 GENE.GHRQ01017686.1~~GHRQ01017686.1.p1  ORF type:complete len:238 (+),score=44.87 GHRQ01017686.1:412-1125(+)